MTTNDTFPAEPEPTELTGLTGPTQTAEARPGTAAEAYQARVRRLADERRRLRG